MIPTELLVAGAALVLAAVWIVRQQLVISGQNDAMEAAYEALQSADKTVDLLKQVLYDVAHNQATLEVTDDGRIIATHRSFGETQIH